ncbi:MAG TPA: VOC family protein [Nocardioidaceae bacterium]|nr:VOC family protein [Nocardioidaceae bacterium]
MRLDHLSYAVGPDGIEGTTSRLSALLGETFRDGGVHPRFGTKNRILPLRDGIYIEIVAVLDHPASDKVPFGQAVRDRSAAGGGWLGWVVAVDDITPVEERLGRLAVQGNRHRPDGFDLRWKQIGVKGLQADPQLPFVVQWEIDDDDHPSAGATGHVALCALEIAGDPGRVQNWLGEPALAALDEVSVDWVAPHGTPGVVAAHFETTNGDVRI